MLGAEAQWVECCLPNVHETLSPISSTAETRCGSTRLEFQRQKDQTFKAAISSVVSSRASLGYGRPKAHPKVSILELERWLRG